MTYHEEIEQLRHQFNKIDRKDPKSLRQWFESHSHLRTTDHAIIANRNLDYIRALKRLAGLGGKPVKKRPTTHPRKVVNIPIPDNWDDPEWLQKIVLKHSILAISQAIGISRRTICRRLAKYKIVDRIDGTDPQNPCYSRAWVHKHYVEDGLSQVKCAKLAGITTAAFTKWLVRLKIPVKTGKEVSVKQKSVKVWCRRLLSDLQKQPIVRKCFVRQDHIHVRFYNYYWETYYPDKVVRIPRSYTITKDQSRLEKVPPVLKQYESDFDQDRHKAHIIIPMNDWRKASFIEQRMAVHEFARQMTQRGWIDPDYPQFVLEDEWHKLCNTNQARYLKNSTFTAFPSVPPPGRRLVEQFFDFRELWEIIKSPRWTIKAINNMVQHRLKTYDTHQFYRSVMSISKNTPRIIDPGFYSVLLKRLGIKGRVLDLSPNHGSRAIACAVNGLTYITEPNSKVKTAIEKGLCDFTGLKYEEYDNGIVDLVVLDNDLRKCSISTAMQYASKSRRIIAFVPRNEKTAVQAKFKPSSIIQVKSNCYAQTPDYLFVW